MAIASSSVSVVISIFSVSERNTGAVAGAKGGGLIFKVITARVNGINFFIQDIIPALSFTVFIGAIGELSLGRRLPLIARSLCILQTFLTLGGQ